MILKNINHNYEYRNIKMCTMFFPLEKIVSSDDGNQNIVVVTEKNDSLLMVDAKAYGKHIHKECKIMDNDDVEFEMSRLLYLALKDLTGFNPPWGMLYGVRPARLMHATVEKIGKTATKEKFLKEHLVSEQKIDLALEVMERENKIIALSQTNSYSLYVSIPFCPSRCSYCSFVSHSIENAKELIDPYVELLCRELEHTGKIANSLNLQLETIYFGGGTPTTLNSKQLKMLFDTIKNNFDLSNLREYTVEAGRPDTVDENKLLTIKNNNVTRISINPQTFNDSVLEKIGRRHTSRQTIDAYNLARQVGIDNINMDLIAGLNGDTLDSFKNSVDTAVDLGAESITVHNLALKSGAYLVTKNENYDLEEKLSTAKMIDYSYNKLKANSYYPYYMYRQSKSLGNLENVGWCKKDLDCLYNVYMMDETHSVFACGGGAVTKLKNQLTGHIDRIYNYKYPYEYVNNFSEVINRKNGIFDFYNAY